MTTPSYANPPDDLTEVFQFPDADVIVRAGGKDFKVHKWPLGYASPVWKDMFSLPLPSTDSIAPIGLPVIDITETAQVTVAMLSFIYPNADDPSLISLPIIPDLMRAFDKYDMPTQAKRVASLLASEPFARTDPVRTFLVARTIGLDEVALTAARHTLHIPWEDLISMDVPEHKSVLAERLLDLIRFRWECGKRAAATIRSKAPIIARASITLSDLDDLP